MSSLHRMSQAVSLILPALFLGLVLSCGSDTKKTEEAGTCASADSIVAEATFASLWSNVFASRCGSCHGVTSNSTTLGGPDLRTQEKFYAQLFGKTVNDYQDWDTAQVTLKDCLTTPFIKAGAASGSLLVAIFDATAVSDLKCTVKPHKEAPQSICISNGSLANLKKWIDNGAAQ